MSTVYDVFHFVVTENRALYPSEQKDGSIKYPDSVTELHERLWRSTRGLFEQLQRETNSKTEEEVYDHLSHVLSKRAEMIYTMVQDHAKTIQA